MLSLGVFGGLYRPLPGISELLVARAKVSPGKRDNAINYFKTDASQPLAEWRRKGWLHKEDPRGWFQWYCRY